MGQIDRKAFFQELSDRYNLQDPAMVDVMNPVFDAWLKRDPMDTRWLAFSLAAAYLFPTWFYDGKPYSSQGADREKMANEKLGWMIDGAITGHKLEEFFTPKWSCWAASYQVLNTNLPANDQGELWDMGIAIGTCLVYSATIALPVPGAIDVMPAA